MRVWLHGDEMRLWLDDSENNRRAIPRKQAENEGLVCQATVSASASDRIWCIYLIYSARSG